MISNEKMEEHWMRYKSEEVAKGLSMRAFCSMHNIPYNAFEKYLKLRRHFSAAHPVKIVGLPDDEKAMETAFPSDSKDAATTSAVIPDTASPKQKPLVRIMIDIRMTNGINIRQKNLDYPESSRLSKKSKRYAESGVTEEFLFPAGAARMRCGAPRILETIKIVYGRYPYGGDIFLFMSKNRRRLKMVQYENNAFYIHEKCLKGAVSS